MRFDFRFVSSQANFIYSYYTHNYTYIKLKNTHGTIFIISGNSANIMLNSSVNHSIVQEIVGRVISNAGEKAVAVYFSTRRFLRKAMAPRRPIPDRVKMMPRASREDGISPS